MMVADLDRLPAPFPGELWYSIVARDIADAGYSQRDLRPRMALGGLTARINISYPNRIHRVLAHLRGRTDLDAIGFARQHTLLPYLLAFDPAHQLEQLLRASHRNDSPLSMVLGKLRCALTPARLRYCRTCRHEDSQTVGEPYWHTAHQVPIVVNCYLHGDRLFDSLVPYEPRQHDFWTAHDIVCTQNTLTAPAPDAQLSPTIAREMGRMNLLAFKQASNLYLDTEQYATVLKGVGFEAQYGQIASGPLARELVRFSTTHGTEAGMLGGRDWWRRLYTRLPQRARPLQHVTMRLFLRERLWQLPSKSTQSRDWESQLMGFTC